MEKILNPSMTIMQIKKGYMDPRVMAGKMKGVPCFILGNAPSLNDHNLSLLDPFFTVGMNRIFLKYDPTVLVWQDLALWSLEKDKVMQTKAIKYVREGADSHGGFFGFKLKGKEAGLTEDIRFLNGRGSTGSITYQFVRALECNPIILVGMDCSYQGDITDFYGKNPMHKAHTLPSCIRGLKFIQRSSNNNVLTIINCSKNSVWDSRCTVEEAIQMLLPGTSGDREKFQRQLLGDQYEEAIKNMV